MKGYKTTMRSNAKQPSKTKEQNMRNRYLRTCAKRTAVESKKAIDIKPNVLFLQTNTYRSKSP